MRLGVAVLRCAVALVLAAPGLWGAGAAAQTVELEPSALAACLQPLPQGSSVPEYPFAAYKFGKVGRVLVELHFTGAELRPAVQVLAQEGDDAFVDAVREHVRQLRVPCLPKGQTVKLRQDYVFQPDTQTVSWSRAVDLQDDVRWAQLKCLRHLGEPKLPDYPAELRRMGLQGRVLVRLRFTADDQAPEAEVLGPRQLAPLQDIIREWVRGYRLPCLGQDPVSTRLIFFFRLGDDAFGFKAMTLVQFVAQTKGWRQAGLKLDTNDMACPFQVKLLYLQPQLKNRVGVAGPPDSRRQWLLDWLANAELDASTRVAVSVFADTADIHVPCQRFDIAPETAR